jgi:hypothetical protein
MPLSPDTLFDAGFGVSKLQTWRARDGEGYTFALTYRGVPVASVEQGGYGGPTDLRWLHIRWDGATFPLPTAATARQRAKDDEAVRVEQEAKAALDALVAGAPTFHFYGQALSMNVDMVLAEILSFHERRKLVAKKVVFVVPSTNQDGLDTEYAVKGPYSPKVGDWIRTRYPTASILNELPAYTEPLPSASAPRSTPATPSAAPVGTGFSAFLKIHA